MPGKVSAEMKKALRLVAKGHSKVEAAMLAGVSRSALYEALKREKAKSEKKPD